MNTDRTDRVADRIDWDDYFLALAEVTAKRSTCPRLSVGAVLVMGKRVVSTGYNGSIHGHPHCTEAGCLLNDQGRCIRTVHAEANAILHARESLEGAVAYVTHEPCEHCTKLLAQAGIERVVFRNAYPNPDNFHFNWHMVWEHRQELLLKAVPQEFKMEYPQEFIQHDKAACAAMREYIKQPKFSVIVMREIAAKYDTTPEAMQKHLECLERERK